MDYHALAQMASNIGDGGELSGDAVQRFGELVAQQAIAEALVSVSHAVAEEREACVAICDEAVQRLLRDGCGHEAVQVEIVAEDIRERFNDKAQ